MRNEHKPLGKAWTDIGSDVNWADYGGLWARHIEGTRYHVIRFENCREWGDGATGYHCDLQEVTIDNPQLAQARLCLDIAADWCGEDGEPLPVLAKVEALSRHRAYAPLWQEAGRNAHKLLRAAKRESRLLSTNAEEYQERMDRPVNAIGTSARNYGLGRIMSGDE